MNKIRKTKAGTYTTRVYVGRDENGKQKFVNITRDTWHECYEAAREVEDEIKNRTYSTAQNEPFSKYAREWLEIKRPELKPSTHKSYKMYIEYHFIPFFGNTKMGKIPEQLCKKYFATKLKSLSRETVRKHYFVLSSIFQDALKLKNPCRDIKPPKRETYKPHVPTDEEFNLIHAAFKGTSDELPILLAAWCGLRVGEIFALKYDDVDPKSKTIRIDESLSISEDGYVAGDPKSENGFRTVTAPDIIFELIEERRKRQKSLSHKIFNIRPDSYSKRFGKLIDEHNALLAEMQKGKVVNLGRKGRGGYCIRNRAFNLQDKPLPDIRFHDLRHFHATLLYEAGVSDKYAASRMGHDVMVMKKIYQHIRDAKAMQEEEKIKKMFS